MIVPDSLFKVSDRVVIVTGGLGQLGRQFTLALLERGARVAVFDLVANPETIAERYPNHKDNPNLMFTALDVTQRTEIETGLRKITEIWGAPYALINNAGVDAPPDAPVIENGPFETYPETSWNKIIDVNVKGVFLCCQVIGGLMATVGQGSIINISSTYGLVSPDQRIYRYRTSNNTPFYKPVAYSTSKSALLNLTRYLATYWANNGIRVNSLTLGGVFNHQDPQFLQNYCNRVPLNRMAQEHEYNGAIIFLISEASSYMTGANLVIDGGWTAW